MNIKEIDNDTDKQCVHNTHDTNQCAIRRTRKPTTTSMKDRQVCKLNKHDINNKAFSKELLKMRNTERSTPRSFIGLKKTCVYKRARQSEQKSVIIQSVLCEVACEQISCGLKFAIVRSSKKLCTYVH